MKLQSLLAGLKNSQNTKTASEADAAPAVSKATTSPLASALKAAVTESAKTASEVSSSPTVDVMKVAAELADADQAVAIKEASLLGAAFADAAVQRFADWQKAAGAVAGEPVIAKLASVQPGQPAADATFQKYAEENPVLARQAMALGYAPTAGGLEKMAEDSYVQGYNDQVGEIHKTASDEFLKAAAVTSVLIERSQNRA